MTPPAERPPVRPDGGTTPGPSDSGPSDRGPTDPTTDPAGSRTAGLADIRETYAEQADVLARFASLESVAMGRYRKRQFWSAEGRVLDVACGLATNVEHLPVSVDAYVGVDLSPELLERAAERYEGLDLGENLREMDAQDLEFPDDSFDTVISSLSTCTFPDPYEALAEMGRVCHPDGRILLLEHGRSDVGPVARFQDWRAEAHYRKHACRWNQDPLALVQRSDLSVRDHWTGALGILVGIDATPARS